MCQYLDFSKCGINADPRRIAQSTAIGFWPWMGSLGTYQNGNWSHKCGASLISDTRVITAAHCVLSEKKVKARSVFFYFGKKIPILNNIASFLIYISIFYWS